MKIFARSIVILSFYGSFLKAEFKPWMKHINDTDLLRCCDFIDCITKPLLLYQRICLAIRQFALLFDQIDCHPFCFCTANHICHICNITGRIHRIRVCFQLIYIVINTHCQKQNISAFSILLNRREVRTAQFFRSDTADGYVSDIIRIRIYIIAQILSPATLCIGRYIVVTCNRRIPTGPDRRFFLRLLNFKRTDRKCSPHAGSRMNIQLTVCHRNRKAVCRIRACHKQ